MKIYTSLSYIEGNHHAVGEEQELLAAQHIGGAHVVGKQRLVPGTAVVEKVAAIPAGGVAECEVLPLALDQAVLIAREEVVECLVETHNLASWGTVELAIGHQLQLDEEVNAMEVALERQVVRAPASQHARPIVFIAADDNGIEELGRPLLEAAVDARRTAGNHTAGQGLTSPHLAVEAAGARMHSTPQGPQMFGHLHIECVPLFRQFPSR